MSYLPRAFGEPLNLDNELNKNDKEYALLMLDKYLNEKVFRSLLKIAFKIHTFEEAVANGKILEDKFLK